MPGERWWWDDVYNPFHGCFPVSPGCKNCFVPAWLASHTHPTDEGAVQHGVITRVNEQWVFSGELTVLRKGHRLWWKPREWEGAEHPKLGDGKPSLLWIGDCTDVFIEGRPLELISRALAMVVISKHIGLVLEKRTELLVDYFLALDPRTVMRWQPKLWLGFSAENQEWFVRRWADMRRLAELGWFIFVSIAPMIGPVILPDDFLALGQQAWVIVSGEQRVPGTHPRPMKRQWARAVRDQCAKAGIPFFFKQMAGGAPIPPDLQNLRHFPSAPPDKFSK